MISIAVTAKLICAFVFAYANCWFSHEVAHLLFAQEYSVHEKTVPCNVAQLHVDLRLCRYEYFTCQDGFVAYPVGNSDCIAHL